MALAKDPGQESVLPGVPAGAAFTPLDAGLIVVLALAWGLAYIFIREGILLGASPLPYASVRYGLSAVAFALVAGVRREPAPSRRGLLISATVGGTLVIGLYGGLLYWGEQYTTGGYASVLSATAPVLTVLVAFFLLPNERLGARALAGIVLGFAGVVVLVAPSITGSPVGTWPGPLFVIGAFGVTAVGSVLLRRIGGGRQGLWQIGSQFATACALLAVATLVLPVGRSVPMTPDLWYSLGALVLVSSLTGYFVYFTLHHRVGPVRANTVAYLLPLVGVGVGSGFFGEPVSAWEIAGFLIVIAGVTLVLWESARSPSPAPSGRRAP